MTISGTEGNRMIREVVSASDLDKEYLTLKVVRHLHDLEIHFRVKRTTMVRQFYQLAALLLICSPPDGKIEEKLQRESWRQWY